jgi:hypothetical protein
MADTVTLPGTGAVVGTDEVTIGGTPQQVQRIKLVDGSDGGTDLLPGSAARGLSTDPRLKVVRLQVTPTISTTPAYTAKDAVGGLMAFSNAVRASGGTCLLQALQLVDKGQQMADLDLVLFDRSITAPTDNAIFAPSDTELGYVVGVLPIAKGMYADLSTNSVAAFNDVGLECVLNGTDLFGVLVARSTPTYTGTGDLVLTLTIAQD